MSFKWAGTILLVSSLGTHIEGDRDVSPYRPRGSKRLKMQALAVWHLFFCRSRVFP